MALAPLTFINGAQLTTAQSQVELIYVAYFGRGGDPTGVQWWINDLNAGGEIDDVAANFAKSAEAQALYPFLAFPSIDSQAFREGFIDQIYDDLFNRAPDAAGLAYWDAQLAGYQADFANGIGGTDDDGNVLNAADFFAFRVGTFILTVALGAQNTAAGQDITTLLAKTEVAGCVTDDISAAGIEWDGVNPPEITLESKVIVDNTTDTNPEAQCDAFAQFVSDFLSNVTVDYTLVTPETLVAPDPAVDTTFRGIVDNNGTNDNSTIQPFDQAIGGANAFNTIQALVLNEDGAIYLNGTNINKIQVTDLDGATFILNGPFVPGGLTGLEQISSVNSDDGSTFEGVQDAVTTVEIIQPTDDFETLAINLAAGVVTPGDDLEVDVNINTVDNWTLDYDNGTGGAADDIVTVYNIHATGLNDGFALNDLTQLLELNIDGTGSVTDLDLDDTPLLHLVDATNLEGDLSFDHDFEVTVPVFDFFGAQGTNEAGFDLTANDQTLNVTSQDGADTFDIDIDGFASNLTVNTAGGDDDVSIFDAAAATGVEVHMGAGSDFLFLNELGTGFILDGGADDGDTVEVNANDIDTDSNGFETNTFTGWETAIIDTDNASADIEFSMVNLPGVTTLVFEDDPEQNVQIEDFTSGSTLVIQDGDTGGGNDWTNDLVLDLISTTDGTLNIELNTDTGNDFDVFNPGLLLLEDVTNLNLQTSDGIDIDLGFLTLESADLETLTISNATPDVQADLDMDLDNILIPLLPTLSTIDLSGMDNSVYDIDLPGNAFLSVPTVPITITLGDFNSGSFLALEDTPGDDFTDTVAFTEFTKGTDLDIDNFVIGGGPAHDLLDFSALGINIGDIVFSNNGGFLDFNVLFGGDTMNVELVGVADNAANQNTVATFNMIF